MSLLLEPLAKVNRHPKVKRARRRYKWTRVRSAYRAHQYLLGNPASRRRFQRQPPALASEQERIVGDLRRDGLAVSSFDALFGDDPLWGDLQAAMGEFVREAEEVAAKQDVATPQSKDTYLIRRARRLQRELKAQGVTPPWPSFSLEDPWIRFGLSPQILETVNSYRRMRTKLIDMDQWYTVPFGATHDRLASQNWHRDPEDLHVVKVFVYFNDVDEEAGPFQYIPGSAKGGRYGDLWKWTVTGETYPSQEELAEKIPSSEYRTLTGPRGTIIFCDTSGFHRGGFARSKPRLMSYTTYVSPASFLSGRESRRFSVDPSENGAVDDAVRFALT